MPLKISFTLSDSDIRHFRRHMKAAHATVSDMGEEAILRAAEGLLQEVSSIELPDFIADRMGKLEVLIDRDLSSWRRARSATEGAAGAEDR